MNPNDPNVRLVVKIVSALGELADSIVLVGGCAAGFLITDDAQPPVRVTQDVDAIVELTTLTQYYEFEEELRQRGFKQDMRDGAPQCRWLFDGAQFDVMPSEPAVFGGSNLWYPEAAATAETAVLPGGLKFRLIQAPAFLGTKFAAFEDRGKKDFYASHDMEDIFAIIDGREELAAELDVAGDELRAYVREKLREASLLDEFWDALAGFYYQEGTQMGRTPIFKARLKRLISTT